MGYFLSKTRSQELKKEKVCELFSDCNFDPNILEICEKGCFDDF
jgi:hypothetical protein